MKDDIYIRELDKGEYGSALDLVWKVFLEYEAPDYSEQGTARVLFFCEHFLLHIKRKCSKNIINFPADGVCPQNGNKTDEQRSIMLSPP